MAQAPRRFIMMWRDGVFIPHDRIKRYCDDTFGEGEIVTFERHEERSTVSHNHYFASIQTAWDNLPEKDDRFPNPEALRKWALIKAGYCTEATTVLDTEEQANTIAGFMGHQEGVIIVVKGPVIKKYTAKSQAVAAMGKQEFQRSKDAVLDIIAQLIEVSRKRLEDNAGRAA